MGWVGFCVSPASPGQCSVPTAERAGNLRAPSFHTSRDTEWNSRWKRLEPPAPDISDVEPGTPRAVKSNHWAWSWGQRTELGGKALTSPPLKTCLAAVNRLKAFFSPLPSVLASSLLKWLEVWWVLSCESPLGPWARHRPWGSKASGQRRSKPRSLSKPEPSSPQCGKYLRPQLWVVD